MIHLRCLPCASYSSSTIFYPSTGERLLIALVGGILAAWNLLAVGTRNLYVLLMSHLEASAPLWDDLATAARVCAALHGVAIPWDDEVDESQTNPPTTPEPSVEVHENDDPILLQCLRKLGREPRRKLSVIYEETFPESKVAADASLEDTRGRRPSRTPLRCSSLLL